VVAVSPPANEVGADIKDAMRRTKAA